MQRFPPRHEVDHPAQRSFSGTAGWGTYAAALEGSNRAQTGKTSRQASSPGAFMEESPWLSSASQHGTRKAATSAKLSPG